MPLPCLKCVIEGVVQGGGLMPSGDEYQIDFEYVPAEGAEVEGTRSLSFVGSVRSGNPADGFSVAGELRGNFGVNPDVDTTSPASVEIYHRDGAAALVQLIVERDDGGHNFVANLQPAGRDAADGMLSGFAFLGWSDREDGPQA